MPNKEGGYAPNYTPMVTTDSHSGSIVDCDLLSEVTESGAAAEAVDRIEQTFGQKPKKFLTDAGNNSGYVMQQMEQRNVAGYRLALPATPSPIGGFELMNEVNSASVTSSAN